MSDDIMVQPETSTDGDLSVERYFERKWGVILTLRAPFDPVCTSEVVAFNAQVSEFERRGVALAGCMSTPTEITPILHWVVGFDLKFSIFNGPIIPFKAPPTRWLCIFNPKGELLCLLHYPATMGRDPAEVIRIIDSLQLTAEQGLSTPAGWTAADPGIEPAPATLAVLKARTAKIK